jgi:hypothetical protein
VEKGADVWVCDDLGLTPVDLAGEKLNELGDQCSALRNEMYMLPSYPCLWEIGGYFLNDVNDIGLDRWISKI